jgi:hypothetical protein
MDRQKRIEYFSLLAHRFVIERLREAPEKVQLLGNTLKRWRLQRGPSRSDPYFDEWERLVEQGIDAIESATCNESDHATVLRSVSPVGCLISVAERNELLARSRAA